MTETWTDSDIECPSQDARCLVDITGAVGCMAFLSPPNNSPQTPSSPLLLDHHSSRSTLRLSSGWPERSARARSRTAKTTTNDRRPHPQTPPGTKNATKARAWSRGCGIIHIETLKNWERNACTPSVRHFPAIIRFLGYVPFGHDGTPGGRLAFLRECVGLTRRQVAWETGIDAVHLWRYERNTSAPDRGYREVWSHLVALAKRGKIWGPDLHAQLGRSRTS